MGKQHFGGHVIEISYLWHLVIIHELELMAVSELLITASSVIKWCPGEMQSHVTDTTKWEMCGKKGTRHNKFNKKKKGLAGTLLVCVCVYISDVRSIQFCN